jgi:hypothetical protein
MRWRCGIIRLPANRWFMYGEPHFFRGFSFSVLGDAAFGNDVWR